MNKLDEVIKNCPVSVYKNGAPDMYFISIKDLETLRPYIELAEFVYHSYFNKLDCSELDWVIKEMDLIVKIKEQEQK